MFLLILSKFVVVFLIWKCFVVLFFKLFFYAAARARFAAPAMQAFIVLGARAPVQAKRCHFDLHALSCVFRVF